MKKIFIGVFTIFLSLFMVNTVSAASAAISVSSSSSRVIVGNTVTITVKISSSSPLGSWQFDVTPSNNLSLVSSSFGGLYIKDVVNSATQYSQTYTFKFKAKSSGTATVAIKNSSVIGYDENNMSVSNGSTSFTTLTQTELEAGYSKNNYLSNLEVEGYNLDFNKDTLDYNLEVENGVTNVNVIATREDSTASVNGSGNISVSEGLNKIEVIVTAQNGSTKTYTINLTVKELNPINITIDGNNFTIIRKANLLPSVNMSYNLTTTQYNGEEIPCYYSDITKYTLIGLKDSEGNIKLYIYSNDNYKLYNESTFNQLAINILDDDVDVPSGYNKTTIKIGDSEYTAYKSDKYDFSLIYGLNLATGKKNLYKYDEAENTIQRYEEVDTTKERLYFNIIVGLLGFITISYIVFILILSSNKKKNIEKAKTKIETKDISEEEKKEILKTMSIDIGGIKEQVKKTNEDKKISKKELKKQKKIEKENKKEQEKLEQKQLEEQELNEKALKIKQAKDLKIKKKEEKKKKKYKNNDSDSMARL